MKQIYIMRDLGNSGHAYTAFLYIESAKVGLALWLVHGLLLIFSVLQHTDIEELIYMYT